MPHILDELTERGLIAQSTDLGALRDAMDEGPLTFYCGFDPTAPSLHIGHLVQLLTMRRLQRAGHRPIAVVGGATGLIGDPRPTSERQLNTREVVAGWVERLRAQIAPYLEFSGANAAIVVNNLDWTAQVSAIDLLRDLGKHFRVNRMLAKEAVSVRLQSDAGISYAEFSYQVLQANDFLELYRRYGCRLQTGGSDQWGNLTAGLDLIHRVEGAVAHAIGTPLIMKADGTKFGKTESGAVWLDPQMTSPYAFYQYWLNSDDRDVVGYLRVFTDRPAAEIAALSEATASRPGAREAQRVLARELTSLVHGPQECARVEAAGNALFGRDGGQLAELDERTLAAALVEVPLARIGAADNPTLAELFEACGLVPSRSAARRAVTEGGAYVNNVRARDPLQVPGDDEWLHGKYLVLRRGRQHVGGVLRDA